VTVSDDLGRAGDDPAAGENRWNQGEMTVRDGDDGVFGDFAADVGELT
jgi:hypothetical protein